MKFTPRPFFFHRIERAYRTHPVVAILGPRQCGKTTLARQYVEKERLNGSVHYFDLEDPTDLSSLENPKILLESLSGLVIIDEVQRLPDLFPIIRLLVDQPQANRRFLILGSASRDLIRQSSETLAGRIAYLELFPFSLFEVGELQKLWVRGGFPPSLLAETTDDSVFWRKQYVRTFLERDIPNLGIRIPPLALRRFWVMLAHYHGQTWNASEIARSLALSDTTMRHYLDILTGTFMVRQLQPWLANSKKRQLKRPKIYFRDSGIYHTLSDVTDYHSLIHHPRLGASWEGFALEQVIRKWGAEPEECFFWGVHGEAELDLMITKNGKRLGFEFKYRDAPRLTRSLRLAVDALELDALTVIYPGDKEYVLGEGVQLRGLKREVEEGEPLL